MSTMTSQITSLTLSTQPFIQAQIKWNIKASRHWSLWGEFTGDRWIPRTNGQQRGKCFHLMTSSWHRLVSVHLPVPWLLSSWPTYERLNRDELTFTLDQLVEYLFMNLMNGGMNVITFTSKGSMQGEMVLLITFTTTRNGRSSRQPVDWHALSRIKDKEHNPWAFEHSLIYEASLRNVRNYFTRDPFNNIGSLYSQLG